MSDLNDELEDLDSDDDYIPAEIIDESEQIRANPVDTGLTRISHSEPPPYIQRYQSGAPLRSAPRDRPRVLRKLKPKYKLKGYKAIYVVMDDKIVVFK